MVIRNASMRDVGALVELDSLCWEPHLAASKQLIEQRIKMYSEGQYVVEIDGVIAGVLYTQRLSDLKELLRVQYRTQHGLFCHDGPVLQLCAIAVRPSARGGSNIGAMLRDHVLRTARQRGDIKQVVAMTRCSNYSTPSDSEPSIPDYGNYVHSLRDPTLFFHVSGGARIIEVVNGYRPEDGGNLGCAVLIEYPFTEAVQLDDASSTLHEYAPVTTEAEEIISQEFECESDAAYSFTSLASEIIEQIKALHNSDQLAVLSEHSTEELEYIPFLDLIDSFQLLSLHSWIENRVNTKLSPTFLFQYSNASRVMEYFRPKAIVSPPRAGSVALTDHSSSPTGSAVGGNSVALEGNSSVAIIGLSLLLPQGINSLAKLNSVLITKSYLATSVPISRWNKDNLSYQDHLLGDASKTAACKYGKFLREQDLGDFDPSEYGLSLSEGIEMDPSQRLLIKAVAQSIADSHIDGLKDRHTSHSVGIFVAMSNSDYQFLDNCGFRGSKSVYGATGGAVSVAAGRLAHIFNFTGPCMVVDTACSSSLVAVHLATQALRRQECEYAVVAGCNLMLSEWITISYARAGMLSPDGQCHTFDTSANGYSRGEGCGAILLQRHFDALRVGSKQYASIRGSAVLHDGRSASLTAPNGHVQAQLLRCALKDAGVDAADVRFVECHGTGTALGDPIEVTALTEVYGEASGRPTTDPLVLSGIKANIGHLEAAAGLAGIFSAILTLHQQAAPANCLVRTLNPVIEKVVAGQPITVPCERTPLIRLASKPLLAAISSFGYSGTISHVILEEGSHRLLDQLTRTTEFSELSTAADRDTCWQFCGQCEVDVGCCQEYFEAESSFREALRDCDDAAMASSVGCSICDILYPHISNRFTVAEAANMLKQTQFLQPVLVSIEYCCACVLLSRGQRPTFLVGHSLGEYTAAVLAGVMSIHSCIAIVAERARLMQENAACVGVMVAVRSSASLVAANLKTTALNSEISIAAVNGEHSLVLSGSREAVQAFLDAFPDIRHKYLKVERAFHSERMLSMIEDFHVAFKGVVFGCSDSRFHVISTVSGKEISQSELSNAEHWLQHVTSTVRYADALEICRELGCTKFIECGPPVNVLTNMCSALPQRECSFVCFRDEVAVSASLPQRFLPYKRPNHQLVAKCEAPIEACRPRLKCECARGLENLLDRCVGDWHPRHNRISPAVLVDAVLGSHILSTFKLAATEPTMKQYSLSNVCFSLSQETRKNSNCGYSFGCCFDHTESPVRCSVDMAESSVMNAAVAEVTSEHLLLTDVPSRLATMMINTGEICRRVGVCNSLLTRAEHWVVEEPLSSQVSTKAVATVPSEFAVTGLQLLDGHCLHPLLFASFLQACALDIHFRYGVTSSSIVFVEKIDDIVVACSPHLLWLQNDHDMTQPALFSLFVRNVRELDSDPLLAEFGLKIFACDGEIIFDPSRQVVCRVSGLKFWWRSSVLLLKDITVKLPQFSTAPILKRHQCLCICSKDLMETVTSSMMTRHPDVALKGVEYSSLPAVLVDRDRSLTYDSILVVLKIEELLSTHCDSDYHHSSSMVVRTWLDNLSLLCSVASSDARVAISLLGTSSTSSTQAIFNAISGSVKPAMLECPRIRFSVVNFPALISSETVVGVMLSTLYSVATPADASPVVIVSKAEERCCEMLAICNSPAKLAVPCPTPVYSGSDGVYIVVGGLGALGLLTCQVLIDLGVDKIVLVSRSGRVKPGEGVLEDQLRQIVALPSVDIRIMQADLSLSVEATNFFDRVQSIVDWKFGSMTSAIEGIIHSAGIIEDGLLVTGAAARGVQSVWAAKATVALNLHNYSVSLAQPLKVFCAFSSVVAAVGNVGQSAYGAANAFVEALIADRVKNSMPGTFIRWPAIYGVGMAAAVGTTEGVLSCQLSTAEAYRVLIQILRDQIHGVVAPDDAGFTVLPRNKAQFDAMMASLAFSRSNLTSLFEPGISIKAFELPKSLIRSTSRTVRSTASRRSRYQKGLLPEVVSMVNEASAPKEVLIAIRSLVESIVNNNAPVDDQLPLMQQGLDSLGATELASRLSSHFSIQLPAIVLFSFPSIAELAGHVSSLLNNQTGVSNAADNGAEEDDRLETHAELGEGDIAIVGVACHYPGNVNSLEELWRLLLSKQDACTEVPPERWDTDLARLADDQANRPSSLDSIRFGGFLSQDIFDHPLSDHSQVGISSAELARMDVSQQLLLRTSIEALQDSGYDLQSQQRDHSGGVFVGASGFLASENSESTAKNKIDQGYSVYDVTGNTLSVASGRISYTLGLRGPCSTTDTACSSSLVALHTARRSLQHHECNFAIVASVNIINKDMSIRCATAGMLSPDGKCHTFDAGANGYCRGEGCAAAVLMRKGDAIRKGCKVYGVIRGSAVMQDGRSASLTAPNGLAQEQLIRAALRDACVDPSEVQLVEAHGTGTALGDPVEVGALTAVYGRTCGRLVSEPLLVSGVKANIGHLEAGAGMAGLFSALLSLQQHSAPPNCHLSKLNPAIEKTVQGEPVCFPQIPMPLKQSTGEPLLAAVSSFGYSGTIAHILLEEGTHRVPVAVGDECPNTHSGSDPEKSEYQEALDRCDEIGQRCFGIRVSTFIAGPQEAVEVVYPEGLAHLSQDSMRRLIAICADYAHGYSVQVPNAEGILTTEDKDLVAAVLDGTITLEECLLSCTE
jgi:acyl transferase domain-containing protein/acyl carrier protein/ribosomal protein S18 acetylase RimI-like enzyme